jgi:hypothetical protein
LNPAIERPLLSRFHELFVPVWTRSFPIAKEPATLGEHLKKKRFGAGIRQSEVQEDGTINKWAIRLMLLLQLTAAPYSCKAACIICSGWHFRRLW